MFELPIDPKQDAWIIDYNKHERLIDEKNWDGHFENRISARLFELRWFWSIFQYKGYNRVGDCLYLNTFKPEHDECPREGCIGKWKYMVALDKNVVARMCTNKECENNKWKRQGDVVTVADFISSTLCWP